MIRQLGMPGLLAARAKCHCRSRNRPKIIRLRPVIEVNLVKDKRPRFPLPSSCAHCIRKGICRPAKEQQSTNWRNTVSELPPECEYGDLIWLSVHVTSRRTVAGIWPFGRSRLMNTHRSRRIGNETKSERFFRSTTQDKPRHALEIPTSDQRRQIVFVSMWKFPHTFAKPLTHFESCCPTMFFCGPQTKSGER